MLMPLVRPCIRWIEDMVPDWLSMPKGPAWKKFKGCKQGPRSSGPSVVHQTPSQVPALH